MKILKIIGTVTAVILVVVIALYFIAPDKQHIERSIVINADPPEVYAELISFENFNAWSPWFEKDPNTQYVFEGPKAGVGTKLSWKSSHPDVGDGAMWIVASEENKMVNNRMKFGDYPGEPFAFFYLESVAEGTKVTWTYDEEVSGVFRIAGLVMDMDNMLGPDYEKGLSKLKTHIETQENLDTLPEEETVPSDSTTVI